MPTEQEVRVAEVFRWEIMDMVENILLKTGIDVTTQPLPDYFTEPVEDADHPLAQIISNRGVSEGGGFDLSD